MSSVRDMYVGISVRDEATRSLTRIDNMINSIENNFRRFGSNINGSFRSMNGLNSRIDLSADNMRTLQQYTSRLEQEMSEARNEMNRMTERIRVAEQETEDLRNEMQRVNNQVNSANKSMGIFGSTASKVVGILGAAFAVDKIKDFGISSIELAAGTQALSSQFDQVFTGIQDTASTSLNDIAEETGVVPDRLKSSFVQMAAFAKTTGVDTAAALSLTERATLAAADSAAFYDRSIEDVTDNIQSFLKGNFENDAALGISATETTRNTKANELYGKSFKKLSESQKQLTLLAMVEDGNKAAGAIGQAARESDGFENQVGNLKSAWDGLKGTLATPFLDSVTSGLGSLTTKLQNVDAAKLGQNLKSTADTIMSVAVPAFDGLKNGLGWIKDNKDTLIAATAGIASGFVALKAITVVKTALDLYKNSTIISTIATQGFNAALRANPIGMVVTAIGLLVTAGVYLYQNWDTVKVKAGELWAKTKEVFGGIYDWAAQKIQPVTGFFKGLYDKFIDFKNAITNFKPPEWVSKIGGAIGKAAGAVGNFISGSHATGLERVPYDGYVAELHKDEAVLTASQSNTLRRSGILSQGGSGTPELNLDNNASVTSTMPQPLSSGNNTTNNTGGNQFIFNISGNNPIDIAKEVREIISDIIDTEMQTI
ncbi:hypothetical protein ABIA69_003362 [Lysinibacillus parviboronicapiens]|uniref:Phage tail tape measure protein n=1 Tax=Lysinibacillus parviboronicapiens TaxID=436516 RepID=A0ABV2PN50_9BACI